MEPAHLYVFGTRESVWIAQTTICAITVFLYDVTGRLQGFAAARIGELADCPMRTTKTVLILTVLASACRCASAADWSFCIAPADEENRIYISERFPSIGSKAEQEFDQALWARRLRHDSVQCPRAADEASAIIMRQHAIEVNREWGRQVIDRPWRPQR